MSVRWNDSRYSSLPQPSQTQRKVSFSPGSRRRSITSPTVLAGRCGEWGVSGGSRKISPSRMGTSTRFPACSVRSTMSPSTW